MKWSDLEQDVILLYIIPSLTKSKRSIFPVCHYFRSLCALVCVVFCVRPRLSIFVLFHETLCFYHIISILFIYSASKLQVCVY